MRVATPLVTCESIKLCGELSMLATASSISKPRFKGPGCIITPSKPLARDSVSPKRSRISDRFLVVANADGRGLIGDLADEEVDLAAEHGRPDADPGEHQAVVTTRQVDVGGVVKVGLGGV